MEQEQTKPAGLGASADLVALVVRYPLPPGVDDLDMSQSDVAQAFNVSTNTVGAWVKRSISALDWSRDMLDTVPVIEIGGQGRAYVLRLSHVWAWYHARQDETEQRKRAARSTIAQVQAAFLNLGDAEDGGDTITPKMQRELAEADILRQKAEQGRRRLVQLVEVVELFESVFAIVRDSLEGMPDRLERELALKPEQVEMVDRVKDDILNAMADRIEAAELRERTVEEIDLTAPLVIA